MIKINVILKSINWTKYIKNPKNLIDRKLKLLNKKNKLFKKNILNCSLLLAQSSEIKKLNKRFRNKNKPTDILSFPFHEKKQLYFKTNISYSQSGLETIPQTLRLITQNVNEIYCVFNH